MKYQPSETELQELELYDPKEQLHFFLSRVIESEELWGLGNASGWVMKEINEQSILPVWPYEIFAENCAAMEWQDYTATAVSLEHFVYKLLPIMNKQNIKVEVFPSKSHPGSLVKATELASLFEGMMESGEYYMEG